MGPMIAAFSPKLTSPPTGGWWKHLESCQTQKIQEFYGVISAGGTFFILWPLFWPAARSIVLGGRVDPAPPLLVKPLPTMIQSAKPS